MSDRMNRSDYFSFSRRALIDRIRVSQARDGVQIVIDHDDYGPQSRIEFTTIETIGM